MSDNYPSATWLPDDPGPDTRIKCERCNGSGLIGCHNVFPCSYVGPGPVPEDARGVYETKCDECGGGWVFP